MLAKNLLVRSGATSSDSGRKALSLKFSENTQYDITDHGYGKDAVKILHVRRNGPVHSIKEFEVGTHLKLFSKKDYLKGKHFQTS